MQKFHRMLSTYLVESSFRNSDSQHCHHICISHVDCRIILYTICYCILCTMYIHTFRLGLSGMGLSGVKQAHYFNLMKETSILVQWSPDQLFDLFYSACCDESEHSLSLSSFLVTLVLMYKVLICFGNLLPLLVSAVCPWAPFLRSLL